MCYGATLRTWALLTEFTKFQTEKKLKSNYCTSSFGLERQSLFLIFETSRASGECHSPILVTAQHLVV
jgi:hypothetical protein